MAASMQVVQDIRKEIAENHEKVVQMVEGVKDDTTAIRDDTGKIKALQMKKKQKGDDFALEPEQQHALYLAVRDGDVATAASLLTDGGSVDLRHTVNCSPFDALWHEPGPDATCLHLAACCLQVDMVRFLLSNGANPAAVANGRKAVDCVDTIDLFAAACAQRPGDVAKVKALLVDIDVLAGRKAVVRAGRGEEYDPRTGKLVQKKVRR